MFKKRILSYLLITAIITGLFSSIPVNKANADDSLMLWYRFNEGTGTKVTDSSGNGRDGILNGNYSWIPAQNGSGAVALDGSSGYIKMPNGILSGLTETTVSTRVFVDPANLNPSWIFNFGTTTDSKSDANAHYLGCLLEANAYRVMLARAHWSDEQNTKVSSAFATGVWKYVTYTQKGNVGTLYVDGVKVAANENVTYAPKDIESTVANFIGRAPYLADNYFKGKVADFRLYNRALSASEVADVSNGIAADIVAMDKSALTLGDLSSVISKITLPTAGENGSTITWASSNTSVVSATGDVTRPKYPETDKLVTLTATITRGSVKDTKVFSVTVKAMQQGEDPIIELAKRQLLIRNADDIRGNITLPKSVVVNGVTVNLAWTTDRPDIVNVNEVVNSGYDSTPAGVVTRPSKDTKVTLTAHLTTGTAAGTADLTITVKAKPKAISESDYKGYFFTYFTGASRSDAEQIYFASSKDGLYWKDLNENNPVMTSTVGDKGVRDPYILRSPDGDKFYMVATDLRIANGKGWDNAGTYGSKSVVIWESNDLVNWSKERLVKVSRDDAGCTWAPEIVFDDKTGEYVMFWASRIGADNFSKFRIYTAKTRDFYTFTEPKLYIDRSNDVIDTTIIKHAGTYYRFSKDEVNKNILIDKCDQLLNKNFTSLPSTSVGGQKGVEGPAIFKFNGQNKWCLLLDYYGGGGYYPMVSTDLASGVFTRLNTSEYKLPTGPRHGTVMQITQAEYDAVMAKWGGIPLKPIEEPKEAPILEYNFDETKTGNAIADTSGNKLTGTLNGNATYVKDSEKNSQVLYLDGSTDTFASFPQGFFDGRDTVTISMDVKPVTASGNFFTFTVGKDTNKYMFLRTRDTESRNAITVNSYTNEQEAKATTVSTANKWMNMKLVITPSSMAIYKDGLMLGRNSNTSISMSDLGTGLLAYLGKSFYADPFFKGYFDNIKVYNRALTETEIAKEFGIPNEPVTITSAENVVITKKAGQIPELPSKVKVTYSNGTTGSAKVTWDSIDNTANSSTGTTTIQGTLYDNEYNNPLVLNRADPCIYKHTDGNYYFTASYTDGSNGHNNVGMYQYDRIVLRKASTIQGLSTATEKVIYTKAPLGGNKSPHVWAPEIHFIDGNWYIYYTTTISSTDVWAIRPHVLMCPGNLDPMVKENWQDKGLVKKTNSSDMAFTGFSLDETVFEHNGKMYMIWAQNDPNSNLYIARMKDPYTIDTNAVKIAQATYDWEIHAYKVNEGPSVIKRNGKIYIAYSASGTDALYCLGLLTASDTSDLLNPNSWVKTPYPVMTLNTEAGQYGPGHNTFTVSEDGSEDILVYHARQEEKYISGSYEPLYDAGRHTRVQKLFWNSDGTPNFGSPFADGKVVSEVKVKATIIENSSTTPILEYKFDETKTGSTIADTSGNKLTGTLNGNAAYVRDSEKNSQVLYLDGTTDTFAAFPQGFFDGRNTVTISMDIKPVTVSGNFFTFTIGKDTNKYMFLRTRDTEIRNAVTVSSYQNEQEVKATTSSTANKWMNIKLVITPTSMSIYKDGLLLSKNNNVSLSMSDLGTSLISYLGKSFYSDPYFKGYFDNVKVYNRELSETEIADEFGVETIAIKGASAVGYNVITTKCDSANKKFAVYFSRSNSNVNDLSAVPLKYDLSDGCTIDGTNGQAVDLTKPVSIKIKMPNQSEQVWTVEGVLCNNPVLGGQFADPDIDVFGDKFYIYPTTDGFTGWSGTQFHAFSSSDMVNWNDEGVILDAGQGKDVPWAVGSAWAPTIEEKNGKYYFYFCAKRSNGASCIGVATSSSPTGPFKAENAPLITPDNLESGVNVGQTIDPSVFTEDDGTSYLLFGNGSPAIVQLNADMISFKSGTMKNLSGATDFRESMIVTKKNGIYHFTWSCDDTGSENYHINYGTSSSLYGPIEYKYTLLSKDANNNILGTGHHSILKLPNKDEYYIAYHRFVTPLGQYSSGLGYHRETCIDKLEFDTNSGLMKVVMPTLEGVAGKSLNDEVIGDYNGDNAVDAIDFALLKQYLLGMRDGFEVKDTMYVGDLNRDSEINAIDLAILKGYLLGVYKELPFER